jgi:hypothetical protein
MTYTGIMLFIVPQGRIAYWINWKIFGLTKTQYGNLHVTFMVLFLVGMALHLYLNWKPLIAYLKNKKREFSLFTKEFILAFGFTLVFLLGTLYEVAPFKTFLDFESDIKSSWEKNGGVPPYGHAELSSLKSLCKKSDIDLEKALASLNEKGFKNIDPNASLLDIAIANNVAPNVIFNTIDIEENEIGYEEESKPSSSEVITPQEGSGLGQMSLEKVSQMYKIDLQKALDILKEKGLSADKDTKMKPLADELEIRPFDLFDIIK